MTMRIDRDFLRGAFTSAAEGRKRKERQRILDAIRRPGLLDLLSWRINADAEAKLTPVPDTGHPFIDRLQWFMENFDEIWAFVEQIIEAISTIFNPSSPAATVQAAVMSLGDIDLRTVDQASLLYEIGRRMLASA